MKLMKWLNWLIVACAVASGIMAIFRSPIVYILWIWLGVVITSRIQIHFMHKHSG